MYTEPAIDAAVSRLVALLRLRDCWFEPFPFDVQLPRIEAGRIVLPGAEPGIKRWQFDGGVELPVRAHGLTLGRFVLVTGVRTCGVVLPPPDRATAIEIADHVAPHIARDLIIQ